MSLRFFGLFIYSVSTIGYASVFDDSFEVLTNSQSINRVLLQNDGKILIGGSFSIVNGLSRAYIARLNSDGGVDSGFDFGLDKPLAYLRIQSDNKLVGVQRSNYSDPLARVVRVNNDGSLDSSFSSNLATTIRDILIQSDGRVLVYADRDRLFRLNVDGTIDNSFSFNASLGGCFPIGEGISTIALQPDGKILLGGCLQYFDGDFIASKILRLNSDGSVDRSLNTDQGPVRGAFSVTNMAVQPDGKIIVVTEPSEHQSGNVLYRLNSNGTLDQSFNLDPHNVDLENNYRNIVIQQDGKILISGGFKTITGASRRGMARLNVDGTVDKSINPEINGLVEDMIPQENGKILVVGIFNNVGGYLVNNIARLNQEGFPLPDGGLCFPIVADDRSAIVCL